MKKYLLQLVLCTLSAFVFAKEEASPLQTLHVQKMMCGSCVSRVKKSISAHPGISDVTVDLGSGEAKFRCDAKVSSCDLGIIKKDLSRIGFPVR